MSLLDQLARRECWERFYEYKTSLACPKAFAGGLRDFIDGKAYLPVCRRIEAGEPFPLPRRSVVSKMSSQKKRVVYTYPEAENTVLKLLTWLLLRRYDGLFEANLYSFRPGRTAKNAIRALRAFPGIGDMWAYKADVSNYFNSVPVEKLLPMLSEALGEDRRLYAFLAALLAEERALSGRETVREPKGIMAGTPLSAFYANLYLRSLDGHFARRGVPYARYSDDIILFAPDRAGTEALAGEVRAILEEHGLALNPAKEEFFDPAEGWIFLGFHCRGGSIDIAPASLEKIKAKMRRKTRALMRWRQRGGYGGEKAAAAFVRIFNRKLLDSPVDNELSWKSWFFPLITTTESLHAIDRYAQDCLRYLISGKRTKGRFNVRYEDLKRLGYRSLVHEYYAFSEETEK
ncbi:MAG: group II intron reverse transcriptase domain-containing protein [Oscillospiraceae bacterium]|nr:group II intron reverse transcriptase domain-containing protein [Oscillospiraceae bacterium]